jgi:hypothetical protein
MLEKEERVAHLVLLTPGAQALLQRGGRAVLERPELADEQLVHACEITPRSTLFPVDRIWWSRLRWRRRGAWMWPLFVVLTLLDGLLLHELPIAGNHTGVLPGMLLAGFFNLAGVAIGGPLLARVIRRRRPDFPKVVAQDYAGAALVVAISLALLTGGLIHRPAVDEQRRDFSAQSAAVRGYVLAQAPRVFRANLDRADTLRLESDLYRTCVPGRDPRRALCLFVSTDQSPPGVRRDRNREPNASFGRPGGFEP